MLERAALRMGPRSNCGPARFDDTFRPGSMYLLIVAIAARTVCRHGRDAGRLDRAECRDLGRSVPDDAVDLFPFAAGQAAFDATGGRGADMTRGGVG